MESNYDVTAMFEDEYGEEISKSWDDVYVETLNPEEEIENLLLKYAERMDLTLLNFNY